MDNTFFSVVIPLYNKADYILRAVDSVLSQTFTDFELLVVDDGSTDGGISRIEPLSDPRMCIYTKENGGVGSARNFGLKRAKGRYVCFLDADDYWLSDFLGDMHQLINQYQDCRFFALSTLIKQGDKQHFVTHKPDKAMVHVIDDYCLERVRRKSNLCPSVGAACVEKNLLMQVGGFAEGVKYGEDLDLWVKLACKSKMVFSNRCQFVYNLDIPNNTTTVYRQPQYVFDFAQWYKYPYHSRSIKLIATREILSMLKDALMARKFHDALYYLRKIRLF